MKPLIRRFVLISGICALGALLVQISRETGQKDAFAAEEQPLITTPTRLVETAEGELRIRLDRDSQQRVGLEKEILTESTLREEVVAYGRLEEDPSRVLTLRAPVAGILNSPPGRHWPYLGEVLSASEVVGTVVPRFKPTERANLELQLTVARADVESINASLSSAQTALERARTLNSENQNVSDQAVDEAESTVKSLQARLEGARQTQSLLESTVGIKAGGGDHVLRVDRGGEVVEILASPGEIVESGQALFRVTRFDQLIARVQLARGKPMDKLPGAARIVPIGDEGRILRGERISLAPSRDFKTLGQGFLFRVPVPQERLRPGTPVVAYLPLSGSPKRGVVVRGSAVIWFKGLAWTYRAIGEEEFCRQLVTTSHPVEDGYFQDSLDSSFQPGDRIVVTGAQMLLSEELKSQIRMEEGGGQ